MTAPLFYVADLSTARVGGRVLVDGPEGHHGATVRRLGAGEPVLVADGTGALVRGTIAGVAKGEFTVNVEAIEDAAAVAGGPRFVLVQALAKEGRDLAAVETATELGVDEVIAWQAARSIVQWRGDRAAKARRKWEQTAYAAAKQSRRPTIPVVSGALSTADLAGRVTSAAATYLLHEDATTPLAGGSQGADGADGANGRELPTSGDVLIIVGPEGGIAPDEVERLVAAGAVPVRLGSTVLRSSSAGPAALAVLLAETRWR